MFGFAAAALIVTGVILMGVRSSALRDRSPVCQVALADLRFSLGKLQMAIWFCLIFAAFVFIWAVTGELGSLTSETFILLGISAGTALGSIAVDQTKARSEEHTSELQSLMRISYAVFCLKKKKTTNI